MKVLKSWGTEGQVVISLSSDDPEDLNPDEPVFITFDGLPVPFFIETIEAKGSRHIVKFEDIDNLKAAEQIVGLPISLSQDYAEEEDGNLSGMIVKDASGCVIGPIVNVADYSGNACITVDYNGREVLLPFHEDLVIEASEDSITLEIPVGLL